MPPRRKGTTVQRDQSQWLAWASVRRIESDEIAKLYRKQADDVEAMLIERGCTTCNPLVILTMTPKGPSSKEPQIVHSLECQS